MSQPAGVQGAEARAAAWREGAHRALAEALCALPAPDLARTPAPQLTAALAALCEAGAFAPALALCRRAQAAGPMAFPAALIGALHASGAPEWRAEALALTRSWAPSAPAKPWQIAQQAQALFWQGAPEEALERAQGWLEAGGEDTPQLLNTLARAALALNRRAEAQRWCARMIARYPDQAAPVLALHRALAEGRAEAMGFDLALPAGAISGAMLEPLLSGRYEAAERAAVLADLRPGDRVLELGAGIGVIALELARAMPGLPVLCLEANPALEAVIAANFAANGCKAQLIGALAALEDGTAEFNLASDFWASSVHELPGTQTQRLSRPSVDVNRLIAEFRPTLLVMDIEGAETGLLPHLALDGLRRLVIEFHPDLCPPATISATLAHLLAQGFTLDLGQGSRQVLVFDRIPVQTD
jgi:FkbM family methyltransferase